MKIDTRHPPRWANRLLRYFCRPDLLEMIEGDLHEEYTAKVHDAPAHAYIRYCTTVIRLCRPPIIRTDFLTGSKPSTIMWKNHFIVARRNLSKHALYSLINIGGLALGVVCFLLIFAFVKHERSFDDFHDNGDRIFQLYMEAHFDGSTEINAVTPTALVPSVIRSVPEIESGVRVYRPGTFFPQLVRRGDIAFDETDILYVDSTFFDVFSFHLDSTAPQTMCLLRQTPWSCRDRLLTNILDAQMLSEKQSNFERHPLPLPVL